MWCLPCRNFFIQVEFAGLPGHQACTPFRESSLNLPHLRPHMISPDFISKCPCTIQHCLLVWTPHSFHFPSRQGVLLHLSKALGFLVHDLRLSQHQPTCLPTRSP